MDENAADSREVSAPVGVLPYRWWKCLRRECLAGSSSAIVGGIRTVTAGDTREYAADHVRCTGHDVVWVDGTQELLAAFPRE